MSIRNRELSQFGSFIYIDDATKTVGIATTATPYVGIGTTNAKYKLHIIGDTNIEGNISVSGMISSPNSSTVGIGTSFPTAPIGGDLFYNADYGRTFVYYDESAVGVGTAAFWVDASPFNMPQEGLSSWDVATNGIDIYRISGSVGIGVSTITEKLTVRGNVSAGQFISTVTSGTPPFSVLSDTQVANLNASFLRGKLPPSGDIVGTTDSQTLTNKVLTSSSVSSTGIGFSGSTSGTTTLQASGTASGTLSLPAVTDTLVGRGTTDTLINKTIAAGSNTITGLTNTNLSGTAGITNANLANSTISGISLGSNLSDLTFGSYLTTSGSYNGSTARTVSVAGTSANTADTLVARDISGDFTAGTISASAFNATSTDAFRIGGTTVINSGRNIINVVNGVFSGIVTATQINTANANFSGIVTASQVNDSAGNVRVLTNNSKSSSYILAIGDIGELINITTGGVTVPSGVFSAGDNVTIYNNSSNSQTITQGSGVTLRLVGTTSTGNRTLDQRGLATVLCVASNEFVISGGGLS